MPLLDFRRLLPRWAYYLRKDLCGRLGVMDEGIVLRSMDKCIFGGGLFITDAISFMLSNV